MSDEQQDPTEAAAGQQLVPAPLRIAAPGIYSLTADQYHADPCIAPSFSRSIAKLLIDYSPAHARSAHPRLGYGGRIIEPDEAPEGQTEGQTTHEDRDVGTVAHAMFLKGESVVEKVEFASYASKAAKARRDEILAAGKVPLKAAKYDATMRLVDALEQFRARTGAFTRGKPEQTLLWQIGETWCRCMVDWLDDDPSATMWDLKTTGGRSSTQTWSRRCFDMGSDLQSVVYPMGSAELRDGIVPASFRYAVVESKAPYGIRTFELSPPALEVAEAKVHYALDIWQRCMAENSWPAYPVEPEWIDVPGYVLKEWEWQTRSGRGLGRVGEDPDAINRFIKAGHLGG